MQDGVLRISGEEWGGVATRQMYRDYHLIVEWKWGGPTHGNRVGKARDSGILVHGVGEDGAAGGTWLESIESQVIEGGTGDLLMVAGKRMPWLTVDGASGAERRVVLAGGRASRSRATAAASTGMAAIPNGRTSKASAARQDVEAPTGEWNRSEVICDGDSITNILNGKVVNRGTESSRSFGKIQLQSEGAEIWIRRVEIAPIDRR